MAMVMALGVGSPEGRAITSDPKRDAEARANRALARREQFRGLFSALQDDAIQRDMVGQKGDATFFVEMAHFLMSEVLEGEATYLANHFST